MWTVISTALLWPCNTVGRSYVYPLYNTLGSYPEPARYVDWGSGIVASLFSFAVTLFIPG